MKKIAFIPIDNRPVCYTLPIQIADIDKDVEIILPPRILLGDLQKNADVIGILKWLENLKQVDILIISLDTVAYGGLIPSRRSSDSFENINKTLNYLKKIIKEKNCKTYAFSSIMRISNNNINEEEKEYWSLYGKRIFDFSFNSHKLECTLDSEIDNKCVCSCSKIPPEILEDYLNTRKRNFEINKNYLEWVKEGILDLLVFSKDDCAQYGFNVKEAQILENLSKQQNLNVLVKTGADEIPLSLMSYALTKDENIKIAPVFFNPKSKDKISKYEDISVEKSVNGQITLCGGIVSDVESADLILCVNNFENAQGEIVMNIYEQENDSVFEPPNKPYFIADILNANGADNKFVEQLFMNTINFKNFFGYSAWNTTGNSLGSAVSAALIRYTAKGYDENAFKRLQVTRFLDDWSYQANVRQKMKKESSVLDEQKLKNEMVEYEKFLFDKFDMDDLQISYKFPWSRFFETEVIIESKNT